MYARSVCLALAAGLALAAPALAGDAAPDPALAAAVAAPQRSSSMAARDPARHPLEELSFFGVTPSSRVVEIWPGGGYWTEILAPYLRDHGQYYAAIQADGDEAVKYSKVMQDKIAADPARYGKVIVTRLGAHAADIAPAGSADLVLTFRNLHNWMKDGTAEATLAAFRAALKPGGILGIEEHRGQRKVEQDPKALDGYVGQDYAIGLVERAGFAFVGASEIDANPKDTAEWPKGVWTLPPTLSLGDQDRAKYEAIGEADNFVLMFKKAE